MAVRERHASIFTKRIMPLIIGDTNFPDIIGNQEKMFDVCLEALLQMTGAITAKSWMEMRKLTRKT